MNLRPNALDSIERFAELCRRLGDAFTARAVVLAEAGLDEASFVAIEQAWMRRLDGELAEQFIAAFSAGEPGPKASDQGADPWRRAAQSVPLLYAGEACMRVVSTPVVAAPTPVSPSLPRAPFDVDRTQELPIGAPSPSTPFRAGAVRELEPPAWHRAPDAMNTPFPESSDLDRTQTCLLDMRHLPALPFKQAPSEPPPQKRLHRFDPQTGLPLPVPVWVELPRKPPANS